MEVGLEHYEVALAAQVGLIRHLEALAGGKPDMYGADKNNGWSLHIEGACGELVVAKLLNLFWNGSFNTYQNGGDVGNLQVRTRSRHDYDLIIRDNAKASDIYVLTTGRAPQFYVHGWIHAKDGMKEEFIATHGGRSPAFFVPSEELYDMVDIVQELGL